MIENGRLGRTELQVPPLGVGTMTWGDPTGMSRYTPATLAYGGADGSAQEAGAFAASLAPPSGGWVSWPTTARR